MDQSQELANREKWGCRATQNSAGHTTHWYARLRDKMDQEAKQTSTWGPSVPETNAKCDETSVVAIYRGETGAISVLNSPRSCQDTMAKCVRHEILSPHAQEHNHMSVNDERKCPKRYRHSALQWQGRIR